jgi:hemerythrin-like domain-containing protein
MDFDSRELNRRGAIALAAALSTGVLAIRPGIIPVRAEDKKDAGGGEDVGATEDLMREHGVLRCTLNVYSDLATRLAGKASVDLPALADAAKLFQDFGEDYHEHMLEETYIFPEIRKAGGPNERLVEVLLAQHQRGREITDYIYKVASQVKLAGHEEALTKALSTFSRMYNAHAAWEDTVLFPAWKTMQSKARLAEIAEKFEDLEHEKFGKDGFEDAVAPISRIEQAFGLQDLGSFTAPAPPTI